jgi:hypothetical protein
MRWFYGRSGVGDLPRLDGTSYLLSSYSSIEPHHGGLLKIPGENALLWWV